MKSLMPNTTQLPNIIIDELLPQLNDTEFRVLLIICRQTLGWIENAATGRRKAEDWISYSQLIEKTGRNRQAISQALKKLKAKELIHVVSASGQEITEHGTLTGVPLFYRLNVDRYENHTDRYENQSMKIIPTKVTHTKDTVSKDTEQSSGNNHTVKGFSSMGDMARKKISEISAKQEAKQARPGGLNTPHQATGYDLWKKLNLPKARLSAYIKAVKESPPGFIATAYAFVADLPDPNKRDKMFFWKLNKLKNPGAAEVPAFIA